MADEKVILEVQIEEGGGGGQRRDSGGRFTGRGAGGAAGTVGRSREQAAKERLARDAARRNRERERMIRREERRVDKAGRNAERAARTAARMVTASTIFSTAVAFFAKRAGMRAARRAGTTTGAPGGMGRGAGGAAKTAGGAAAGAAGAAGGAAARGAAGGAAAGAAGAGAAGTAGAATIAGGLAMGAAALVGFTAAMVLANSATKRFAEDLKNVSGNLAGAFARREVREIEARIRQDAQIGEELAELVDLRTDASVALRQIATNVIEPMLPALINIQRTIVAILEFIAGNEDLEEDLKNADFFKWLGNDDEFLRERRVEAKNVPGLRAAAPGGGP